MAHNHPDNISNLSIDCVIFGFEKSELKVLLAKRNLELAHGQWALPGGFIRHAESIDDASARILMERTGVEVFMEQMKAYGEVDRYPDRRVVTIAYYALANPELHHLKPGEDSLDVKWFPISSVPALPFDHNLILDEALAILKRRVRHQPIGFELLPQKFTLLQLQELYEAILQVEVDKSNFRRKITSMGLLVKSGEYQKDVAHRAAQLYSFDRDLYEELKEKGFIFEVAFRDPATSKTAKVQN